MAILIAGHTTTTQTRQNTKNPIGRRLEQRGMSFQNFLSSTQPPTKLSTCNNPIMNILAVSWPPKFNMFQPSVFPNPSVYITAVSSQILHVAVQIQTILPPALGDDNSPQIPSPNRNNQNFTFNPCKQFATILCLQLICMIFCGKVLCDSYDDLFGELLLSQSTTRNVMQQEQFCRKKFSGFFF